jgi:histidyl-tRNA synthetase
MIRAIKGTKDILPDEAALWQSCESSARSLLARYGYRELRTPIFEETQLFARGIGLETDIVSKEMYTFEDREREAAGHDGRRAGLSLTLRPEATAGVVRSVIQHNLANTDPLLKLYSIGPMFRREQPQKGRQRQFHQINVEAFGLSKPSTDVEIIELAIELLRACGLEEHELILNSVGDAACRPSYVARLREALKNEGKKLCDNCQRRAETNPLRVLDCKVPHDQEIINRLPRIGDHLCEACREHFDEVRRLLDRLGIRYRLSHRLVRGLDYYVRTTFEITSGALGAQNSVLGGGRYDGLVRQLGGGDLPGIGFALGMERLVLILESQGVAPATRCDVFLVPLATGALDQALLLSRELRQKGLRVLLDHEGRGLKSQMKKADRLGARFVALLGEAEMAAGHWTVRDMRGSEQMEIAADAVASYLRERIDDGRTR